ncbi:MAG: methyltransferase domain-containing protein [Candidatus Nanopelagicales bacterium]|nr:methyltransferase domain-containing protein [Candidatus Nanopelagicales bacterium]
MTICLDLDVLRQLETEAPRVGGSIWRDQHVQQQLLRAHLDESNDLATRLPATVEATIDWLVAGLPAGAAVLDLGCGPGLYAQRLADRGFDVTGVDVNAASLQHARGRAKGTVRYVLADYSVDMPPGPFDLVVMIYLDFGTHLPPVQRRVLEMVRSRLRPAGRFIFDHLDASAASRHAPGREWAASTTGGFWAPGAHLLLTEHFVDEGALAQRIHYTLLTEAGTRSFDVWEHCFTEASIREMVTAAGFSHLALHRGVTADMAADGDHTVFAVATA